MRLTPVVLLGAALCRCDCSGRDVDTYQYRCSAESDCGAGWTCFGGTCVNASTVGGGSGGGGGATAGGGGGAAGGGVLPDACDLELNPHCNAGFGCLWSPSGASETAGVCQAGCDPVQQDCGPGMKCSRVSVNADSQLACVPNGTTGIDQPCTVAAPDDCVKGTICVPDFDASASHCRVFCNWVLAECRAGEYCATAVDIPPGGQALVCTPPVCSLLQQNCADAGCYPALGGAGSCLPAGQLVTGLPCANDSDCAAGRACALQNGAMLCVQMCNADGGVPKCPGSSHCKPATDVTGKSLEGGHAGFCG